MRINDLSECKRQEHRNGNEWAGRNQQEEIMREFTITANEANQRFDKYLKKLLCNAPGSFIYKMLRKKNIVLNGKKADGTEKLNAGDGVKLFLSDDTFEKFSGNDKTSTEFEELKKLSNLLMQGKPELKAVYEDVHVIIINKPSGMLSQKAGPTDISANEYLLAYLIGKGELTEEMLHTFRPSICNRLDRNTSGLLIAGKTLEGLQQMAEALKQRSLQKYYRCIVAGEVTEPSYLKGWLKKDEKSNQVTVLKERPKEQPEEDSRSEKFLPIETEYRPIQVLNGYTELEVHLITGRSHQIRAHLASIGHPIVGDLKYGKKQINERFKKEVQVTSQLLHAYRMVFPKGIMGDSDKPLEVTAPYGEDFRRTLTYLKS